MKFLTFKKKFFKIYFFEIQYVKKKIKKSVKKDKKKFAKCFLNLFVFFSFVITIR